MNGNTQHQKPFLERIYDASHQARRAVNTHSLPTLGSLKIFHANTPASSFPNTVNGTTIDSVNQPAVLEDSVDNLSSSNAYTFCQQDMTSHVGSVESHMIDEVSCATYGYEGDWMNVTTADAAALTGWSVSQTLTAPAQDTAIRCKWEGCGYEGSFAREADLVRHVKSVHISRGSYVCFAIGCDKSFNRKDNLVAHVRRRHA